MPTRRRGLITQEMPIPTSAVVTMINRRNPEIGSDKRMDSGDLTFGDKIQLTSDVGANKNSGEGGWLYPQCAGEVASAPCSWRAKPQRNPEAAS